MLILIAVQNDFPNQQNLCGKQTIIVASGFIKRTVQIALVLIRFLPNCDAAYT
ncbi:MAG: hypothetical protein RR791_04045 [Lachnospiraceae bacterium]